MYQPKFRTLYKKIENFFSVLNYLFNLEKNLFFKFGNILNCTSLVLE